MFDYFGLLEFCLIEYDQRSNLEGAVTTVVRNPRMKEGH